MDDNAKLDFYTNFDRLRPGRAAFFALQKACGRSVTAIAKQQGVSTDLIRRELRWAARQGHFDKAQDRLFQLLNKAVDVYEQALDDKSTVRGDKDVARDLLNGAGVLGKHLTVSPGGGDGADRETFEVWRARFSRPAHQASLAGGGAGALPAAPDHDQPVEGRAEATGPRGDLPVVDGVAVDSGEPQ